MPPNDNAKMRNGKGVEPAQAAARATELLAYGANAVDEIGRRAGADAADALKFLEGISASTGTLLQVNLRLVPLMTSFQQQRGKNKLWRWFTGQALEYDVLFQDMRTQIEQLAATGQHEHAGMANQVKLLATQYKLMHTEIKLLETDIAAARLLASPAYAGERLAAGIGEDDLARLVRRSSNLEAMASATQLTQAQFKLAIEHAKTVSDRYREIRTLLLPIWKQSVGFDLFSRSVSDHLD